MFLGFHDVLHYRDGVILHVSPACKTSRLNRHVYWDLTHPMVQVLER